MVQPIDWDLSLRLLGRRRWRTNLRGEITPSLRHLRIRIDPRLKTRVAPARLRLAVLRFELECPRSAARKPRSGARAHETHRTRTFRSACPKAIGMVKRFRFRNRDEPGGQRKKSQPSATRRCQFPARNTVAR